MTVVALGLGAADANGAEGVPENITRPVVSGRAIVGHELALSTGAWTNNPTSYTYGWIRCNKLLECVGVGTDPTYVPDESDVSQFPPPGVAIFGGVVAHNAAGSSSPAVADGFSVGPNHPPSCAPLAASTIHGHGVSLHIDCRDEDEDPISLSLGQSPPSALGGLTGPDALGNLFYQPPYPFIGTMTFSVRASDGVDVTDLNGQVGVTDRVPVCATSGSVTTTEDRPIIISAMCADPDADPLTIAPTRQPAHGRLSAFVAGTATYTAASHFTGRDIVKFAASDAIRTSTPRTVTVEVTESKRTIRRHVNAVMRRLRSGRLRLTHRRLSLPSIERGVLPRGTRVRLRLSSGPLRLGAALLTVRRGATKVRIKLSKRGRRLITEDHRSATLHIVIRAPGLRAARRNRHIRHFG